MISAAIYIFSAVVLFIIGFKSLANYRKGGQNFIAKGFIGFGFLGGIANLLLGVDVLFAVQGLHQHSVIADAIATAFLFLSMFPTIWMTCQLLQHPRLGRLLQVLVAIIGTYVSFTVLSQTQTTTINQSGIATYFDGGVSTLIFGLTILAIYTWVFAVFIRIGMKNPKIRIKLFTLGSGFMMVTWSAAVLAVLPRNSYSYVIGYSVLFVGYALQLIGTFLETQHS